MANKNREKAKSISNRLAFSRDRLRCLSQNRLLDLLDEIRRQFPVALIVEALSFIFHSFIL